MQLAVTSVTKECVNYLTQKTEKPKNRKTEKPKPSGNNLNNEEELLETKEEEEEEEGVVFLRGGGVFRIPPEGVLTFASAIVLLVLASTGVVT